MGTISVTVNGGDGARSYMRNSSLQRGGRTETALISEAIAEKLDVNQFLASSSTINIADFGCRVGPNTFIAVDNIVASFKGKYESQSNKWKDIEFQVFFNDHVSNDFNTLFKTLPSNRQYFAAGVPGPIHTRLFPKASLHFAYSAYTLHWLTKVPDELADRRSPAFTTERIFYTNASKEVSKAYAAQFARDMGAFLNARAEELVFGGLMALILPCHEADLSPSQNLVVGVVDLLGDSLMDMANKGLVSEEKANSFNFPKHNPTPKELEEIVSRNEHFTIERMEKLVTTDTIKVLSATIFTIHLRNAWEGLIKEHFGNEVINELFELFHKKLVASSILTEESLKAIVECFVLHQRTAT